MNRLWSVKSVIRHFVMLAVTIVTLGLMYLFIVNASTDGGAQLTIPIILVVIGITAWQSVVVYWYAVKLTPAMLVGGFKRIFAIEDEKDLAGYAEKQRLKHYKRRKKELKRQLKQTSDLAQREEIRQMLVLVEEKIVENQKDLDEARKLSKELEEHAYSEAMGEYLGRVTEGMKDRSIDRENDIYHSDSYYFGKKPDRTDFSYGKAKPQPIRGLLSVLFSVVPLVLAPVMPLFYMDALYGKLKNSVGLLLMIGIGLTVTALLVQLVHPILSLCIGDKGKSKDSEANTEPKQNP